MIDRAMFLLISTKGAERLLIDLLYRHNDLWKIVDYKTDKIDSKKQQKELTDFYKAAKSVTNVRSRELEAFYSKDEALQWLKTK